MIYEHFEINFDSCEQYICRVKLKSCQQCNLRLFTQQQRKSVCSVGDAVLLQRLTFYVLFTSAKTINSCRAATCQTVIVALDRYYHLRWSLVKTLKSLIHWFLQNFHCTNVHTRIKCIHVKIQCDFLKLIDDNYASNWIYAYRLRWLSGIR